MGNGGNYQEHMFTPSYCLLIIVRLTHGSMLKWIFMLLWASHAMWDACKKHRWGVSRVNLKRVSIFCSHILVPSLPRRGLLGFMCVWVFVFFLIMHKSIFRQFLHIQLMLINSLLSKLIKGNKRFVWRE